MIIKMCLANSIRDGFNCYTHTHTFMFAMFAIIPSLFRSSGRSFDRSSDRSFYDYLLHCGWVRVGRITTPPDSKDYVGGLHCMCTCVHAV